MAGGASRDNQIRVMLARKSTVKSFRAARGGFIGARIVELFVSRILLVRVRELLDAWLWKAAPPAAATDVSADPELTRFPLTRIPSGSR